MDTEELNEGDRCPRFVCDGEMGYLTLMDSFSGNLNCLSCMAPMVVYDDPEIEQICSDMSKALQEEIDKEIVAAIRKYMNKKEDNGE